MPETTLISYASPEDPKLKAALIKSIERLTGKHKLERAYQAITAHHLPQRSFWDGALSELNVDVQYDPEQMQKIPARGPVIFIANHPFGVLDGLIICQIAKRSRGTFKVLVNSALCRVAELEPYLLPINFDETRAAMMTNIATKRAAMAELKGGGAIAIFPAGAISTAERPFGPVTDMEWKLFTAKLIQMTGATVVPIFFHGQNSRLFQLASQISLTLRLSLIIHEVNRKIGETIRVNIGDPIPAADLAHINSRRALLAHLRRETYALADQ